MKFDSNRVSSEQRQQANELHGLCVMPLSSVRDYLYQKIGPQCEHVWLTIFNV